MAVAIVLAAGSSARFGGNKLFQPIAGKPLLFYPLKQFQDFPLVSKIIVALNKNDFTRTASVIESFKLSKVGKSVEGGTERQHSVFNCLKKMDKKKLRVVIIHDAARPVIDQTILENGFNALKTYDADGAIPVLPVTDTLKEVINNNLVAKTLNRSNIYITQTPQFFKFDILYNCHKKAQKDNLLGTDDAFLLEKYNHKVACFAGDRKNIKVTYKEDLKLANCILRASENE